jgi:hypothetical protein
LAKKEISHDFALDEKGTVAMKGKKTSFPLLLEIRANIQIRGLPRKISLGKFKDESFTVSRYIRLASPPNRTFQIINISSSNSAVKVTYSKKWFASEYDIQLQFDMKDMKQGQNVVILKMDYQLDGVEKSQSCLLFFEKVPKILIPSSISLGVFNKGTQVVKKQFEISPGYEGVQFKVKRIVTEPAEFIQCKWKEMADNRIHCDITCTLPLENKEGAFQGKISFEFFGDQMKPVGIPIYGIKLN